MLLHIPLSYLLDAAADPQLAEYYEYNYFNLRTLISNMSKEGVEETIINIPVPDNVPDAHVDLEKIRTWLKSCCGQEDYFGSDVDGDLPWVKDMVLERDHFKYYLFIFIRDMEITANWLLQKWTEAIGRAPEIPDYLL